jgi:hypothetical protein
MRAKNRRGSEHARLIPAKPDLAILGASHLRQQTVPLHPIFRYDAERPIIQAYHVFPARDCLQEFRHLHRRTFELRAPFQVEPIDSGPNLDVDASRSSVQFAFGFNLPAFGNE